MAHKPEFKVALEISPNRDGFVIEFGYYILGRPLFKSATSFTIQNPDPIQMNNDLADMVNVLTFAYSMVESKEVKAAKTYEQKLEVIDNFINAASLETGGNG